MLEALIELDFLEYVEDYFRWNKNIGCRRHDFVINKSI